MEFFSEAKKLKLKNSKLVAFGSTRRKDLTCKEDANLQSLLSAETEYVCIFGKTWDFQVTDIIHASLNENIDMIRETCAYLKEQGKHVFFDAEHFFTGVEAENTLYHVWKQPLKEELSVFPCAKQRAVPCQINAPWL